MRNKKAKMIRRLGDLTQFLKQVFLEHPGESMPSPANPDPGRRAYRRAKRVFRGMTLGQIKQYLQTEIMLKGV